MKNGTALLIVADSSLSADLYYATRFLVEVTVIYLEIDGRKLLLVNDLEYGRAGTEARVDDVISTTPYEERLLGAGKPIRMMNVLDLLLKEQGVEALTVPGSFPFGHARRLQELGYELEIRDEPFFSERTVKSPEEVEAIEESQAHMEEAMELAVSTIRDAEVRGGSLYVRGKALTSERLRLELQRFLLEKGVLATNIIVAGGDQGTDPHRRGSGPLAANETIILDIFAQSMRTRYWGDMTRTVVRGKASAGAKKLFQDVLDAQELALSRIQDGADGQKIHEAVADLLKERGNQNGEDGGRKTGFFHGTGHGIGLEIHESPRIGRLGSKLKTNQVVTVEPGLYYPGVGAVRLEDAVVVTKDGCRNLNRYPKELEV